MAPQDSNPGVIYFSVASDMPVGKIGPSIFGEAFFMSCSVYCSSLFSSVELCLHQETRNPGAARSGGWHLQAGQTAHKSLEFNTGFYCWLR